MRSVRSAICTSGDPVSVSLRRYFSTVAAFDGRFSAIVTGFSLTANLQNATPHFQLPATRPAPQPHHPPVAHPNATVFADSEQRKQRQFSHEPPVGVKSQPLLPRQVRTQMMRLCYVEVCATLKDRTRRGREGRHQAWRQHLKPRKTTAL